LAGQNSGGATGRAEKHCFVLIFLWFVSFHQGKEMNVQLTEWRRIQNYKIEMADFKVNDSKKYQKLPERENTTYNNGEQQ